MDLAISYARFSATHQGEGDSEDRQARDFAAFCARHHLKPARQSFIDRGRSGFHGHHRSKGDLGVLESMAKAGVFPRGTTLVIESWDRLSRQRPDQTVELVAGLLRCGLRIGICRLDDVFTEQDLGSAKWTILSLFAQLAYQESKQKSERISASWSQRRLRARQGQPTGAPLPGWLTYQGGKIVPIPERVAAVRRIFELAGAGYGHIRIVRKLHAEGVPAFGEVRIRPGRRRSQYQGRWSKNYIALILSDRRVTGEYQPTSKGRQPDGEPIKGYYPAVIDQATWDLATTDRAKRAPTGTRQRRHVNPFTGLVRSATDGSCYCLRNRGTAQHSLLTLTNYDTLAGQAGIDYGVFEAAVLTLLKEVTPADLAPQHQPSQITVLQARYDALEADLQAISADLSNGYSQRISVILRQKEQEQAKVMESLEIARAEAADPLDAAWQQFPTLADAITNAPDPDDARVRLGAVLRRAVSVIHILVIPKGKERFAFVEVNFVTGLKRIFIVKHRPPISVCGRPRPGYWWAMSSVTTERTWTDLTDPGEQAAARDFAALWQEHPDDVPGAGPGWIRQALPAQQVRTTTV